MNNPFEKEIIKSEELVKKENILIKLDKFEEKIELIKKLNKEYEDLKEEIKSAMIKAGKQIKADQIRWLTPKGIKITCTIGKPATFEKVKEKKFSEAFLLEHYPEIYEKCIVEKEVNKEITKSVSDRLVITPTKEN